MREKPKTDYYWQEKANGMRHYVEGLDWLHKRRKQIVMIDVYKPDLRRKAARVTAYLQNGLVFCALFPTHEEAKQFVVGSMFDHSNKEIYSA